MFEELPGAAHTPGTAATIDRQVTAATRSLLRRGVARKGDTECCFVLMASKDYHLMKYDVCIFPIQISLYV